MEWNEAKDKFIQTWGSLGSSWGVSRTMAQVHALLLIAPRPMCADEIKQELRISTGNANMNIRLLIDWGLVYKEGKAGDRKEYFTAEKDIWKVVRQIMIQRKKKELEPMLRVLDEVSDVNCNCDQSVEFNRVVQDIKKLSSKADATLDMLIKADQNILFSTLFKMVR